MKFIIYDTKILSIKSSKVHGYIIVFNSVKSVNTKNITAIKNILLKYLAS